MKMYEKMAIASFSRWRCPVCNRFIKSPVHWTGNVGFNSCHCGETLKFERVTFSLSEDKEDLEVQNAKFEEEIKKAFTKLLPAEPIAPMFDDLKKDPYSRIFGIPVDEKELKLVVPLDFTTRPNFLSKLHKYAAIKNLDLEILIMGLAAFGYKKVVLNK